MAVRAVLRTIRDSEGLHENNTWKGDADVGAAVLAGANAKEGPKAIMEKRSTQFHGR